MRTNHHPFGPICTDRRLRAGFTLVELMVVVGIIGLLIAIVLPAVNAARIQARVATTRAMISVLETGVEQFRADHLVGGSYPESFRRPIATSPHGGPITTTGAYLVAWAVVGADLLGTPGFRDLDGDGMWYDMDDVPVLYAIGADHRPSVSRSGPFVDIDKMEFPQWNGVVGGFVIERHPQAGVLQSICFLDSFSQPILYYRAQTRNSLMVENLDRATESFNPPPPEERGIYNLDDNVEITGTGANGRDLGAGPTHFMNGLGPTDQMPDPANDPNYRNTFAHTVWNPTVAAVRVGRPHRSDSFILISPGPDALYGTADDVANFEVNK